VCEGGRRIVFLEQMLHRLQILGRSLESFDLLMQLRVLGLFVEQNLVDIFQEKPPTRTLPLLSAGSNGGYSALDYVGK
jgi:hypothetical protein